MPQIGRSQRSRKLPIRYSFEDMTTYASTLECGRGDMDAYALTVEPSTVSKPVQRRERDQQVAAMCKGQSLELMKLPKGRQVVECKRVHKKKEFGV